MSLVDITDVTLHPSDVIPLVGCSIDYPRPNSHTDIYEIDVAGWVLGPDGPPEAIELIQDDQLLRQIVLNIPRVEVAKLFPDVPNAERCGFWTSCGVTSLGTQFKIEIDALFQNNVRVRLGTISGRHQPLRSSFQPTLQPLMLTSLGRTGTTWLMQLLSQHPAIVAHTAHPNEVKSGSYWMHMLTVLAEPANLGQSAHPDSFDATPFWVGNQPFHSVGITGRNSALREWLGRQYVEDLAGFCQRSIENFYVHLGMTQGRTSPMYFAEKHRPEKLPRIIWELYPKSREVFLVRDFRDMLCSIFAFNARRGFSSFGREQAGDDEDYVRQLRSDAERLIAEWTERSHRAHLVRYEDLVLHPEPTLEALFSYLDLDRDPLTIHGILERASTDTEESREHRTSSDPKSSIGRWRCEADPQLRRWCDETFTDLLPAFDYADHAVTA